MLPNDDLNASALVIYPVRTKVVSGLEVKPRGVSATCRSDQVTCARTSMMARRGLDSWRQAYASLFLHPLKTGPEVSKMCV